ncbi:M23 family metallopeptidase [Marinobacterium arenosum]|uniref:M23 family metallopeptidase n=1 Tax=Marinobacterium arenosum TaxID=2862496 RepID=UPI001C965908|nr:peptidoglycan DD-metalloendopeptidase family protein [Marinobacterium arenosum]MBY4677888.1 peptidoglycan DD-metalloendopeptidase family protein [Marinobacterium arenosum]
MKRKLVITLTTVYGSTQYTLGQAAKYLFLLFLLLAALSFFVSNGLLMITRDSLADLEQDHLQLQASYAEVSDSQQLFMREKDELDSALSELRLERDSLAQENQRFAQAIDRINQLEGLLGISGEGLSTAERMEALRRVAEQRKYLLHQIPNGLPMDGKPQITDRFGMRHHPVYKKRMQHGGIDFRASVGTPVYATADGVVEYAAFHKKSGYGKLIILQHNFGFKTYFGHLDKMEVQSRQFVRKGQLIGYSGNTGVSTGPHLHYEVRHLFSRLNPEPFLALNMTNVDSIFSQIRSVEWASLKKLYPLNPNARP